MPPEDYSGGEGFDANFLGQRVLLPGLAGAETVLLAYTHFTELMRSDTRPDGSHGVRRAGHPGPRRQAFLHHIYLAAATALHHDQRQQRLLLNDQSDSAMTQDFAFAW